MRTGFCCTIILLAALYIPAEAAGPKYGAASHSPRQYGWRVPVKDCTRLNGRYGYYGNPWCNKAEQLRWDRWDARRSTRFRND